MYHTCMKPWDSHAATECGQCGERLFIADWAEHVDERRTRYLWQCGACSYAFETTVSFAHGEFPSHESQEL